MKLMNLQFLKETELHVHIGGCLHWHDFLEMSKDHFKKIDWSLYEKSYFRAFGCLPGLKHLIKKALDGDGNALKKFRKLFVYGEEDGGDFHKFQAKFNLLICLFRYYHKLNAYDQIIRKIIHTHKKEGIKYIEYRMLYPIANETNALDFHLLHARIIKEESDSTFQAKYLPGVPRDEILRGAALIQKLMLENPTFSSSIAGLDFCHIEEGFPPKTVKPLLKKYEYDQSCMVFPCLPIVYHVGESYFDKSIESAIRWCHQAAEMGFKRLGHCIALGLAPEIAMKRKPQAHVYETVEERLDQIDYDLKNLDKLFDYGIDIDVKMYLKEKEKLNTFARNKLIKRTYNNKRLEELKCRQLFVLDQLTELGAVIECCPTSNLRIGGVPDVRHHPIHKFLDSNVKLAICSDDPGIFDSPLSSEIDWVINNTKYDEESLKIRLEDPLNYKLRI
jgi:hypothetical protein